MSRSNQDWVQLLRLPEPRCNAAIEELHVTLLRGLRATFSNRPDIDRTVLEDLTQEALLKILDSLDTFRGESRFMTWAMKIAVRLTLTELRRRRWKDVSLDELEAGGFEPPSVDGAANPEKEVVRKAVVEMLRRAVRQDLTEKQRQALVAIRFKGMPLEEAARRLGTNRNSLYKLMHDARKRLRRSLLAGELSEREITEAFG